MELGLGLRLGMELGLGGEPGSPSRMTSCDDSKLTIDMLSAINPT